MIRSWATLVPFISHTQTSLRGIAPDRHSGYRDEVTRTADTPVRICHRIMKQSWAWYHHTMYSQSVAVLPKNVTLIAIKVIRTADTPKICYRVDGNVLSYAGTIHQPHGIHTCGSKRQRMSPGYRCWSHSEAIGVRLGERMALCHAWAILL